MSGERGTARVGSEKTSGQTGFRKYVNKKCPQIFFLMAFRQRELWAVGGVGLWALSIGPPASVFFFGPLLLCLFHGPQESRKYCPRQI